MEHQLLQDSFLGKDPEKHRGIPLLQVQTQTHPHGQRPLQQHHPRRDINLGLPAWLKRQSHPIHLLLLSPGRTASNSLADTHNAKGQQRQRPLFDPALPEGVRRSKHRTWMHQPFLQGQQIAIGCHHWRVCHAIVRLGAAQPRRV